MIDGITTPRKKPVTINNNHPLKQITKGNITTVLIKMNNDTEFIIRREYDKTAKACKETPYTRAEYESLYGELTM